MIMPEQPEVPEAVKPGNPYALPELTRAEIEQLELDAKTEAETAERVATVRTEQEQVIANLGNDNLPHFLVTEDGMERCGTDGEPWPCRAWTEEVQPVQVAESSGVPEEAFTAAEVTAAEALGITAAEVRARFGPPKSVG